MPMKPSPAQMAALRMVQAWANRGTYMPFAANVRSYEACEHHGWLEYRSVDQGSPYNGYALTAAGRELLANG